MTYLDSKSLNSHLVPGQPIGDAKTFETRGVKIAIDAQGFPLPRETMTKGAVVYINGQGQAVPFTQPSEDFKDDQRPVPYGVVYQLNVKTDLKDITPHSNEAKIVVNGVVPVKMKEDQTKPHVGQMVNPYGGAMIPTANGYAMQPLGICDGTEDRYDGTYVAVRLTPGSGSYSNELLTPRFIDCKYMDDNPSQKITKYEPVYAKGQQERYSANYMAKVGRVTKGETQTILGFAWNDNDATPGEVIPVLYFGVGYFPYIFASNPAVAKLTDENNGKVPSRFHIRLTHPDGTVKLFPAILAVVLPAVGLLINTGLSIYHEIKDSKAPGKVAEVVPNNTAKYRALLKAEGDGVFDVEPDGYVGVFVNPGINTPAPVTGQAALIEPEGDKRKNLLIREGKCYVGSAEGVRPYDEGQGDVPEAVSFYGVAAEPIAEDEDTNLPVSLIRCIREGTANVRPYYEPGWKEKWLRGRFVDISGKVVDPADEEFVPHIGKVIEDADADANDDPNDEDNNWLGMVDIRPYNPNQYIVIDHCKVVADMARRTSVFVKQATTTEAGIATADVGFAGGSAEHVYTGVTGVIVRLDRNFYGEGEYDDRAIIQISGYVRCQFNPADPLTPGTKIKYMEEGIVTGIGSEDPTESAYMNILGTLLRTDPSADGSEPHWWVVLAPRTQYVAPLAESKKE